MSYLHICNMAGPVLTLGKYLFEMHSYCGPIRLKKNGDPARTDFGADFWPLFERWRAAGSKIDPEGNGILGNDVHEYTNKHKYTTTSLRIKKLEHVTDGKDCWCGPEIQIVEGSRIFIHNEIH